MENINFKIAEIDAALTYYLQQLPVGVAYYILKDKVEQFKILYTNQAMQQQEEVAKAMQEQQNKNTEEQ